MADHYDALETRDPDARERDLFARLSEIVARALTAPGWASHLAGVDPASVTSRAALPRLPLLRKSDLVALQKAHPPFGGLNVTPAGKVRRMQLTPGPSFAPAGFGTGIDSGPQPLRAPGFEPRDSLPDSSA